MLFIMLMGDQCLDLYQGSRVRLIEPLLPRGHKTTHSPAYTPNTSKSPCHQAAWGQARLQQADRVIRVALRRL